MSNDVVTVGQNTTLLGDGSRLISTPTTRVIEALVRLLGVDVVLEELRNPGVLSPPLSCAGCGVRLYVNTGGEVEPICFDCGKNNPQ